MVLRKLVLELAIRTSCISHVLPPKVIWTSREESRASAARERALALAPAFACSSRVTAQMEKSRSLFWRQFFSLGAFSRSSPTGFKYKLSQEFIIISHSWMTKQWNHLPLPCSVARTSNLLRAIRGSRNPNLQVAITHARDVCKFAIIKTRRKLGRVRFCKDFWDRFWGRAGQLLANFFSLSPGTSQKPLQKITRDSFCLVSKKPGPGCSNVG